MITSSRRHRSHSVPVDTTTPGPRKPLWHRPGVTKFHSVFFHGRVWTRRSKITYVYSRCVWCMWCLGPTPKPDPTHEVDPRQGPAPSRRSHTSPVPRVDEDETSVESRGVLGLGESHTTPVVPPPPVPTPPTTPPGPDQSSVLRSVRAPTVFGRDPRSVLVHRYSSVRGTGRSPPGRPRDRGKVHGRRVGPGLRPGSSRASRTSTDPWCTH